MHNNFSGLVRFIDTVFVKFADQIIDEETCKFTHANEVRTNSTCNDVEG